MTIRGLRESVGSFSDNRVLAPFFHFGNGDREYTDYTDLLGPNLNHIPESISFSIYYVNLTLKHESDIIFNSY